MSVDQFLNYVQFSTVRPDRVSPGRWAAMLAWLVMEDKHADDRELWAEQHVLC